MRANPSEPTISESYDPTSPVESMSVVILPAAVPTGKSAF